MGKRFGPMELSTPFLETRGGIFEVKVEVVDTLLHYNLILSHNLTYVIESMVSYLYKVIKFPH